VINPEEFPPFVSWYERMENEYSEQIGGALLAFNKIENDVSELIGSILYQRDRMDLIKPTLNKQLSGRVDALALLLTSEPKFPRVPIARINALAGQRNNFAHSHFTFDPNTSDPITKGKGEIKRWDAADIEPFMREAHDLHSELSTLAAWVAFGPGPAPLPPGASATPTEAAQ